MLLLPRVDLDGGGIACPVDGCHWGLRVSYPDNIPIPELLVTGFLANHYTEAHRGQVESLVYCTAQVLDEYAVAVFTHFKVDPENPYESFIPGVAH
jgi:hypothetical protein